MLNIHYIFIYIYSIKENNDFKSFEFDLIRYFSVTSPISKDDFEKGDEIKCIEKTYQLVLEYYEKKNKENATKVFPIVKNVYENPQNKFERIVVPFTDGKKKSAAYSVK